MTTSAATRGVAVAVEATIDAGAEVARGVGQAEVVRPEVVPPLGDAMGLVDHEQADARLAHPLDEPGRGEALRSHVEEAHLAGGRPLDHLGVRARVLLGVDERDAVREPARAERLHLVLHERHERRHHDREVVAQQRRELVAERLAGARGHDHEHVAAGEGGLAGLELAGPEGGETEVLPQSCGEIWHVIHPSGGGGGRGPPKRLCCTEVSIRCAESGA